MTKSQLKGDWTDALFGRKKSGSNPSAAAKPAKKIRFAGHCPYCGDAMMRHDNNTRKRPTKDHVMARSLGYSLNGNKIVCCEECNLHKGDRTLVQWLVALLKKGDPKSLNRASRVKAIIERRRSGGFEVDTLPIDDGTKTVV